MRDLATRLYVKNYSCPDALERYLHEIFVEDNKILLNPAAEEIATQVNIFREQLSLQRQQVLDDIANNPETDEMTRIEAHRLAAEIGWIIVKLSYETPAGIVRHTKIDATKMIESQKGLNLELKT